MPVGGLANILRYKPAAAAAPITTIFSLALNADDGGYGTWSWRNVVTVTGGPGSLGQIRATWEASSAGGLDADHCSIAISSQATTPNAGDEDATAAPVEFLFSGGHGFSLSASQTITSDWLSFAAFTSSSQLLLATIDAGTNGNFRIKTDNASNLYRAHFVSGPAANYNQQNIVPTSDIGNGIYGLNKIEVR